MLSLSPLAHSLAFSHRRTPNVKLTDLRSDVSDTTVYTFTACQVDIGGTLSTADTVVNENPYVPSPSRNAIGVVVHGEDAAATFNVSSVTIGGVSGVETFDRGGAGAGILVNTAFYTFDTELLQNITDTDVVVTFSEAVTGCAVAVLSMENLGLWFPVTSGGSTTGSGTLSVANASTALGGLIPGIRGLHFVFSTVNAAGESFEFALASSSTFASSFPVLLYEGSNAEFGYAGAYTYAIQTRESTLEGNFWDVSWSGAADADAITPTTIKI